MKNLYYAIMSIILFIIWIPIAILFLSAALLFRLVSPAQRWFINTAIWMRGEVTRDKVVKEYDKKNKTP